MHPARLSATVRTISFTAGLAAFFAGLAAWPGPLEGADLRLELREGWTIQSSA